MVRMAMVRMAVVIRLMTRDQALSHVMARVVCVAHPGGVSDTPVDTVGAWWKSYLKRPCHSVVLLMYIYLYLQHLDSFSHKGILMWKLFLVETFHRKENLRGE